MVNSPGLGTLWDGGVPHTVAVTAGGVSIPYEILGPVAVDTTRVVNVGAVVNDVLFRSPLARSIAPTPKANPAQMYEALRGQALTIYGSHVDAVINATTTTDANGNVFAHGLAVHFTTVVSPSPVRSATERLRELDGCAMRARSLPTNTNESAPKS